MSATSLPSRGAWIEISLMIRQADNVLTSLPSRGAWIEIRPSGISSARPMSLPSRGAWIEIKTGQPVRLHHHLSLPSRGAWIEM